MFSLVSCLGLLLWLGFFLAVGFIGMVNLKLLYVVYPGMDGLLIGESS